MATSTSTDTASRLEIAEDNPSKHIISWQALFTLIIHKSQKSVVENNSELRFSILNFFCTRVQSVS